MSSISTLPLPVSMLRSPLTAEAVTRPLPVSARRLPVRSPTAMAPEWVSRSRSPATFSALTAPTPWRTRRPAPSGTAMVRSAHISRPRPLPLTVTFWPEMPAKTRFSQEDSSTFSSRKWMVDEPLPSSG